MCLWKILLKHIQDFVWKVSSKDIQLCNQNQNLIDNLRTTTFLSFEIAYLRPWPNILNTDGKLKLPCNSANVGPAGIKSLVFLLWRYLNCHANGGLTDWSVLSVAPFGGGLYGGAVRLLGEKKFPHLSHAKTQVRGQLTHKLWGVRCH